MASQTFTTLFKNPSRHAVGLDITGHRVRFVALRRASRGVHSIRSFGEFPIEPGSMMQGEILHPDAVLKSIQEVLRHLRAYHISVGSWYSSIPDSQCFLKLLTLNVSDERDIEESVRWESSQHIPYDMNELTYDWSTDYGVSGERRVCVIATKTKTSESYTDVLNRSGVDVMSLEPATLAAARVYRSSLRGQHVLLVNIGENESYAMALQEGVPYLLASLPVTVSDLDQIASKMFHLGEQDTKKVLRVIGYSKQRARGVIRNSLVPFSESLIDRLSHIFHYLQEHESNVPPIRHVMITGAGAGIAGLADYIQEKEGNLIVYVSELPGDVKTEKSTVQFQREHHRYDVALGCALGGSSV